MSACGRNITTCFEHRSTRNLPKLELENTKRRSHLPHLLKRSEVFSQVVLRMIIGRELVLTVPVRYSTRILVRKYCLEKPASAYLPHAYESDDADDAKTQEAQLLP